MEEHPIERFDPLLRNMLSWHLVEESPAGGWQLRADVVQRLNGLARLSRPSEPHEVVYFGHNCAGCRSNGLTRFSDGRYLCDECRRAADVAEVATLLPPPAERKGRRTVFSRARKIAS